MLRLVEKHDLEEACRLCGMTLDDLFDETGIPVEELRRFANGEHPLNAGERFAILRVILTRLPPQRPIKTVEEVVTSFQLSWAVDDLCREMDEEDEQV